MICRFVSDEKLEKALKHDKGLCLPCSAPTDSK